MTVLNYRLAIVLETNAGLIQYYLITDYALRTSLDALIYVAYTEFQMFRQSNRHHGFYFTHHRYSWVIINTKLWKDHQMMVNVHFIISNPIYRGSGQSARNRV